MIGSQVLPSANAQTKTLDEQLKLHAYPIGERYLGKFFFSIAIWAVVILGFIWIIDPYGVSPLKIKLTKFNLYKPERLDIDRLIKPLEVWRYQPKTIFIGTSRIHQSMDPAVFKGTDYAPAYNAAIPASTLWENAGHIEQFLKLDHKIKHIFVELFLYNFSQPYSATPSKTWREFLNNAVSLEISIDAFIAAVKTLYINLTFKQTQDTIPAQIAEGGYRVPKSDFNPGDTFNEKLFMNTVIQWNRASPLRFPEDAFAPLDRIVALAHQHGVQLHLIITPNFPWDDYRLMTLGYWPLLEKWLRKVATYPNVVSYSQYNKLLEEEPTQEPRMKWWNDPTHFSLNMGRILLNAYLGHTDAATPKNLLRVLNLKTVEAIIAERRAGLLKWAAQHPDFVQNFEDTKNSRDIESGKLNIADKILTLNGKNHPLVLGEGEVSFTQATKDALVASGWTADELTRRPVLELVATSGTAVIAQGFPSVKRPDIELAFNKPGLLSGFAISIPREKLTTHEALRVFAIMRDSRAVQLPSADNLIDGIPVAVPLGQIKENKVVIGKKSYSIINSSAGIIEHINPYSQGYRVEGWVTAKAKILAIIAIDGTKVLAKSLPTLRREDGNKGNPTGFSMLVPINNPQQQQKAPKLRLFALLADGGAWPLKARS